MNGKPALSRVLAIVGAVIFFGGVIAAIAGSASVGVVLVVAGVVIFLSSWVVLAKNVMDYKKEVEHVQAQRQQQADQLDQVVQDAWRASGAEEAMRRHQKDG